MYINDQLNKLGIFADTLEITEYILKTIGSAKTTKDRNTVEVVFDRLGTDKPIGYVIIFRFKIIKVEKGDLMELTWHTHHFDHDFYKDNLFKSEIEYNKRAVMDWIVKNV